MPKAWLDTPAGITVPAASGEADNPDVDGKASDITLVDVRQRQVDSEVSAILSVVAKPFNATHKAGSVGTPGLGPACAIPGPGTCPG